MSLALRAAVAILLMIGFYALAIGLAGSLFWLAWAMVVDGHHVYPKLIAFCVIGGGLILWSIVPRVDRFEAPGPRLEPTGSPRLFAMLSDLARRTGQPMPADVFLVPDVNAFVANRGGILGIGTRRVMGIGLPLLQVLTVSELRAVLAHEFGHYVGGDTQLGPWLYRTRSAIGRTLGNLSGEQGALRLVAVPFQWYGAMFLRVTHAVSRRQERDADALAARTVGARAFATALEKVHAVAPAFPFYWRSEVTPVLGSGRRPPLAAGFGAFVAAPEIAQQIERTLASQRADATSDPGDTHPPLGERLAALAALRPGEPLADDPPAITLLRDVGALEGDLVGHLAPTAKLSPVAWEDVGREVVLPSWKAMMAKRGAALAGVAPADLPAAVADVAGLVARLLAPDTAPTDPEQRRAAVAALAGVHLGLAMHAAGWDIVSMPGRPVELVRAGERVDPRAWVGELLDGGVDADAWRSRCAEAGLAV
jgi:Zn-dependent protease with chaperone function